MAMDMGMAELSSGGSGAGVATAAGRIAALQVFLESGLIGGAVLVERLLIGLLADGHLLIEGAPGLAKTKIKFREVSLRGGGIRIGRDDRHHDGRVAGHGDAVPIYPDDSGRKCDLVFNEL